MLFTNRSNKTTHAHGRFRRKEFLSLVVSLALTAAACGSANSDSEGRRLPSDAKVIADVTPADTENVVDVDVVKNRSGESYLHRDDLVWYFDRGVVIKRKAGLAEAPDALVVVGGLARYQLVGDRYEYARFLTTYNEYEGIPAPSESELTEYVEDNLKKVFVSRDHNIVEISSIRLKPDTPWTWHAPTSFSVPFQISYKHRNSNTTIEERDDLFDIRFYKKKIDEPIHALMATEKSRVVVGKRTLTADAIEQMKTLRTDFK
jgi:hypothetical protein